MKLKVSLQQHGTQAHDIQITADGRATVGDVAMALAHSDQLTGQWPADRPLTLRLHLPQHSVAVATDRALLESGIRSGSRIEIAFAEDAARDAQRQRTAAVVRIVTGADAGREFPIAEGIATIGRSAANDIQLSDPLVSKRHARLTVGARIEIADDNSANGVWVGGRRVAGKTLLGPGDLAEIGDTTLLVVATGAPELDGVSTEIGFVRSPRVVARPVDTRIELPDPPRQSPGARFPWLSLVAPLVMGAVLYLTTKSALSLVFVGLSPILMLGNYLDQRTQRKRAFRDEVASFESGLKASDTQLTNGQQREREELLALHPSLAECLTAIRTRTPLLWSRRPEHPEFLQVRVGLGSIAPLHHAVAPRPGGLVEFHDKAVAVADDHAVLEDAPVVVEVRSVGGLGVCGPAQYVEGVARGLVTQLVALHSPAELSVACLTSDDGRHRWGFLEWVPHTSSPHSPLPGFHLAADPETGRLLLSKLEELVMLRSGGRAAALRGPLGRDDGADPPTVPSVVVVVDDATVDLARLSRIAEQGPDVGVFLVWVARGVAALPAACRAFVEVTETGMASIGMVRQGRTAGPVVCEMLSRESATELARSLAPVVDAGAPVDDQSDLPRSVSVVSLLTAEASDDPSVVLGRWRQNQSIVDRSAEPRPRDKPLGLHAVVGHDGAGRLSLDLRSQGPHALVGGTTNAGKSEFLQAWVLGMAHAYSPDRVTFLFVDYKGGSAFADVEKLPHNVGMVTDLSPYLVRRALDSLRAELTKREHLLNEKGKKDLIELEMTGDPDCPPSLIIVVDEFAALAKEMPEFVDGMVDIAARGRSLGLHLILATQRPAGVIKENLRANVNLRIALRMADEHDSQDVLGDEMAAHFPASIPGRAAAKTGPGRITPFQSAFPGARTTPVPDVQPIDVVDLDFGRSRDWKLPERVRSAVRVPKDVERVVGSIAAAAVDGQVARPKRPWLESLAATYNLARFSMRRDTRLPLGILDDPKQQAQLHEYFEPDEEGNILYVGTGGSGKSTALRSLGVASAVTPGGGVVHVYGLDFGGGQLGYLEALPNVGSIVTGDDDERVRRLLDHLSTIADERKELYPAHGASSLREYRQFASQPDEPRYLLLLDGFSSFRDEYESAIGRMTVYQQFQRLLLEGRAVGIHVAMTADRPNAVPNSVLSSFRRRVVLRLADEDAYLGMGVPRDVLNSTSPPGRAVQVGKPQELQLAVFLTEEAAAAGNTSSAAQLTAMQALSQDIADLHRRRPAPIESLPAVIASADLPTIVDGRPTLGVGDTTLGPVGFDASGMILLAGPSQSGRTNAMRWLATSIRRVHDDVPLVHFSARRSPLTGLDLWSLSADSEAAILAHLEGITAIATDQAPRTRPLVALFIEYLPEFIGTTLEGPLQALLSQCRRNGHLVVADGETPSWTSPWPLILEVRNARTGLILQPDQADGDSLLRTDLPRGKRTDFPPGRGFWVKSGKAEKIQLPLVEEWVDGPMDQSPSLTESSSAHHSLQEAL